jgi:VWFA-related protein
MGQTPQAPQFRGGTRLILVDAHVVGKKDGKPIEGLTAAQFEVFIDGRKRAIESVEFVRTAGADGDGPGASPVPAAGSAAAATPSAARPGRIIMLVVDQASFPVSAQTSAREAATRVVNSVSPDDYLGLVAIPGGIEIGPTRNHMEIRNAIPRIAGQRMDAISPQFNISASEASALKSRDSSARDIIKRECARDPRNVQCPKEVEAEGSHIADLLEAQAMLSITGLRGVLDGMERLPGRKTLLLVSAGIPMSTRPGGRPNVKIETEDVGRRAARGNVSLFVLYMNVHFLRTFSAQFGRRNSAIFDDITMFGQGLEQVADSGGGTFFQVQVQSDPFVARAMRESSASYVLAVQAAPEEQDGKEHFIRVTTKARDSELRFRRIVVIPRESSKF